MKASKVKPKAATGNLRRSYSRHGVRAERVSKEVYSVVDLAKRWDCTDQHVFDLIEEGHLQALNIGGAGKHFWRVFAEAVRRFERPDASSGARGAGSGDDLPGPPTEGRIFRVDDLKVRWGCTATHVLNLIDLGFLGALNLGGRAKRFWRVSGDRVRAFEVERSSMSIPEAVGRAPQRGGKAR